MSPKTHLTESHKLSESSKDSPSANDMSFPTNMYWRRYTRASNLLKTSNAVPRDQSQQASKLDIKPKKDPKKPQVRRYHSGEFTTQYVADKSGGVSRVLGTYRQGKRVESECVQWGLFT